METRAYIVVFVAVRLIREPCIYVGLFCAQRLSPYTYDLFAGISLFSPEATESRNLLFGETGPHCEKESEQRAAGDMNKGEHTIALRRRLCSLLTG